MKRWNIRTQDGGGAVTSLGEERISGVLVGWMGMDGVEWNDGESGKGDLEGKGPMGGGCWGLVSFLMGDGLGGPEMACDGAFGEVDATARNVYRGLVVVLWMRRIESNRGLR